MAFKCNRCKEYFCNNCLKEGNCSNCIKELKKCNYCDEEGKENCSECDELTCPEHKYECPECGNIYCQRCESDILILCSCCNYIIGCINCTK